MKKPMTLSSRQRGASMLDFIFWIGLAALVVAGITAMASSGKGKYKVSATLTDVTEIRQAVDAWAGAGADVTGVSLSEICTEGYGYSKAAWCSVNQYGGTYTVTANTNKSFVDIGISNVEVENSLALGNQLAPMSAERCTRAGTDCGSVQVSGSDITVTL
ncbi:hypothetical protein LRP52_43030 [Photobacterium sp. ZSDE20]|uniref:MSHA biogenesis protein MshP n=1 Tax=Photobacterium pectinilyticum TaxID=2906793 RepID=A0ABT1N8A6_9GAMM|nr:hypothetical protein [Photobacterium sp. ZSDE20]MCQ1060966.1 hypothetical protein [Photobacterium sp. ZSDE20]MDD1828948.1 hypothetical protein [Photobacterium sp. ZSDE20]